MKEGKHTTNCGGKKEAKDTTGVRGVNHKESSEKEKKGTATRESGWGERV